MTVSRGNIFQYMSAFPGSSPGAFADFLECNSFMISGFTIRLGPEGLKNLSLADETSAVFDEITEYVKALERGGPRLPRRQGSGFTVSTGMAESLHCAGP